MLLHQINKNFGVKIFKNPNSLNYNLFNFFLRKNIVNDNEKLLNSYHNLGYLKPDVDSRELANFLSQKIQDPNAKKIENRGNKYSSLYVIDKEMRAKIKDHLNNKFKDIVDALKRYYGSGIAITNIQIRRNHGIEDTSYYSKKERTKQFEYYNMYFHCDYNTMNFFKLFISLQDISVDHGPLTFYSIEDTKKFVSKSNYRDRNFYDDLSLENEIKNCGKSGDSLILNTPQCIHRAGIPKFGNHRDVLFINFVAIPEKIGDIFHFEKDHENDIWGLDILSKRFSKPKNLRETLNLYRSFKKSSLDVS